MYKILFLTLATLVMAQTSNVTQAAMALTGQPPQNASNLILPKGFSAQLLYTVTKSTQGSWVSLAKDNQGNLYASDQYKNGIYRITPAKLNTPNAKTTVQKLEIPITGAQGLCYINNTLYANVSVGNKIGVWKITDSNNDGIPNNAQHIIPLNGGGEHGPHAIIPTQDGKSLYFVGGNHTALPKFNASKSTPNWKEDLILPRQWDARGHARGVLAPGGWIAKTDLNGKNTTIISTGFRNQYDIAINPEGDIFTFDADMEWDMGMPWYRPTRICHATSGSEFGWRSGTGKWPDYYPDSSPAVLNIGPGSPTGAVFGTGARFPEKYQKALFVLDWTFGTIYAIHLNPKGASYTAKKQEFISSKPLPVTDAVIGQDGAFYFIVGGRGAQSALYRVTYTGTQPTNAVKQSSKTNLARETRLNLEKFHGNKSPLAIAAAWQHLDHKDRTVRYAARVAIENQPVNQWRSKALAEPQKPIALTALMALARQGSPSDQKPIINKLNEINLKTLNPWQKQTLIRTYSLALIRLGNADNTTKQSIINTLKHQYPINKDENANIELTRLLVYLQSPTIAAQSLKHLKSLKKQPLPNWAALIKRNAQYGGPINTMLNNMPPVRKLRYAKILRNLKTGWTYPLRKQYFTIFNDAAKHPGGASYNGFLDNLREEAMANCTQQERDQLADLLGVSLIAELPKNVTQPKGPGQEWTIPTALKQVGKNLTGRNYKQGKNLFNALLCSTCHRLNGQGGAIGPDLSTLAGKFSKHDILEAIVLPSKVISDQYSSQIVTTTDNETYEGRVVHFEDHVKVYTKAPEEPAEKIKRKNIKSIEKSTLSQMPENLLNRLNPEELKDLIAYLITNGNPKAAAYK